jgi:tetratricopeptide (TPR) repeat protein
MDKPAPRPSRGRPDPRPRPARPPAEAAPKPKSRLPLYLGIGGGGAALIAVVLVAALTGAKRPVRAEAEDPAPPPPAPVAKAPPKTEDVEARMRREAEEARRRFAEEEAKKNEAARKAAAEARAREEAEQRKAAAEAAREKADAEARRTEAKGAFDARRRERKAASAKALEEGRQALAEQKRAQAEREKAVTAKLRNLKVNVTLKNGMKLENAGIQSMTRDEIRLAFTFEGAQAEQVFPTDFLDDKSYVDLLRAAWKDGGAAGQYELGRALVLRKLWKDAKAAFDQCVKLDASFGPRVPDLARVLNNEGAFKGSARRLGSDQLLIAYDFADTAQAQDFTPRQAGGEIAVEAGVLRIGTKATALYSLKDVDFEGAFQSDFSVTLDEGASLAIGAFFTWDRKGYLIVLNSRTPSGNVLYKLDGGRLTAIARTETSRIAPGVETRIRIAVDGGSFRVHVGADEALSAVDASTTARGWFVLGTSAGAARVKGLSVRGKVNPVEIQKRFAEAEVLVRRALEEDLGRKRKETPDDAALSGEDEYLLGRLDEGLRAEFLKQRAAYLAALRDKKLQPAHGALFDELTKKAPDFAPGWYWRGKVLATFRRSDESREAFAKAAAADPGFAEAHRAVAKAAMDERDLEDARAAVKRALELAADDGESLALQGLLRFVSGDAKGALADLDLARVLEPGSEDVVQAQRNVVNVIKGPQHLGAKHVKEFPHFVVMTDMSKEKTELYGSRLEAAYRHYAETFKEHFAEDPKRPKPRVAVFNTREAYLTYGELTLSGRQEWTLGYFHPLFKELLLFEDVDIDATLQTLYHEAFHHFMNLIAPRTPFWFNEGIAEYMGGLKIEVSKRDAKVVEKARILDGRLKVLRGALPLALPFKDIMLQTPGQFYSGPVSFKYAQAWSMVHFFYETPAHRPRIEAYVRALVKGEPAKGAFDAAFGDAPLEAMQKEWLEYVKGLKKQNPGSGT